MFKAIVTVMPSSKEGKLVGWDYAETEIAIPFAPCAGMDLEFYTRDGDDPVWLSITKVIWHHPQGNFTIDTALRFGHRETAEAMELAGFKVTFPKPTSRPAPTAAPATRVTAFR